MNQVLNILRFMLRLKIWIMHIALLAWEVSYLYGNIELGSYNRYAMLLDYCFQKQRVFFFFDTQHHNGISVPGTMYKNKEKKQRNLARGVVTNVSNRRIWDKCPEVVPLCFRCISSHKRHNSITSYWFFTRLWGVLADLKKHTSTSSSHAVIDWTM